MMKSTVKTLFVVSSLFAFAGCASAPKVLVDHSFRGETKTSKVLLELSGDAQDAKLYNSYIRLCDLKDLKETACKDTLVLPNVVAEGIY